MWLDLPLAVGTVGGLTSLHPLSKLSLAMMGSPSAENLMKDNSGRGLHSKLWSTKKPCDDRNSARAYEDAPYEYFKINLMPVRKSD